MLSETGRTIKHIFRGSSRVCFYNHDRYLKGRMWNYLRNDSSSAVKSHREFGTSAARRTDVANRFTRIVLKRFYENGSEFWNKFASVLLPLIYITTDLALILTRTGPERPRLTILQCSLSTIHHRIHLLKKKDTYILVVILFFLLLPGR